MSAQLHPLLLECAEAAGMRPKRDSASVRTDLCHRLATIPEARWGELSDAAKSWYDDAVAAVDEDREPPLFGAYAPGPSPASEGEAPSGEAAAPAGEPGPKPKAKPKAARARSGDKARARARTEAAAKPVAGESKKVRIFRSLIRCSGGTFQEWRDHCASSLGIIFPDPIKAGTHKAQLKVALVVLAEEGCLSEKGLSVLEGILFRRGKRPGGASPDGD